jgi:glycosyltransferase involved in cell wall biosynthesis
VSQLCVVMAVYNEELLLPGALQSLDAAGVSMSDVLVFDGAWDRFDELMVDQSEEPVMRIGRGSTDETAWVVEKFAARWLPVPSVGWESQEAKRTAMFLQAVAEGYTHAFVMDADERVEGRFPAELPDGHANVMVKCVGPNDLPGIRGEWPHGDYYPDYKPELRLFKLSPALHCKWPGGYWDEQGQVQPYADARGTSALPVLDGVSFTHHGGERSPERLAEKIRYYEQEHPQRAERQRRVLMGEMSVDDLRSLWKSHRRRWHRGRIDKADPEVLRGHVEAMNEIEKIVNERLNPRST